MSAPKKSKVAPAPEPQPDQVLVTLPDTFQSPVVIEHLRAGKVAGSLAVYAPDLWSHDVARVCIRHVSMGGALEDIERKAVMEYFERAVRE